MSNMVSVFFNVVILVIDPMKCFDLKPANDMYATQAQLTFSMCL